MEKWFIKKYINYYLKLYHSALMNRMQVLIVFCIFSFYDSDLNILQELVLQHVDVGDGLQHNVQLGGGLAGQVGEHGL